MKRSLNVLIKLAKLSDIDWYSLSAPLMLGDWSWNTDKNGNIIVNDTYDFNIGEGKKQKGRYGELRRWACEHLSRSIDQDSQKIKFRINLGNPKDCGKYDKGKFMSFNEPYREIFPGMYYYN